MCFYIFFILGFLFGNQILSAQAFILKSGETSLVIEKKEAQAYTFYITYGEKMYRPLHLDMPVYFEIDSLEKSVNYQKITQIKNSLICMAKMQTKMGSEFEIKDVFSKNIAAGFLLERTVKIIKAGDGDHWFNSYFGINGMKKKEITDYDFFVPGLWYKDNKYLPTYALASDYTLSYYYFREDRLPLPLVMWRDKESRTTFSLIHEEADPKTFWGEFGHDRIVDKRLQFGAMGFIQKKGITTGFMFPGSEGDKTYIGKNKQDKSSWALRSHPVKAGFEQHYKLNFQFSKTVDYAEAVQKVWRLAYKIYNPELYTVDIQEVYNEEIKLFDAYWANLNGAPGLPFSVYLPNGKPRAYNYQMGFIGFQLPIAYYLLRNGFEQQDQKQIAKGILSVDFWVNHASTASGLPRTWADAHVDRKAIWRDYPTYMRVAGDGMEGALNAWNFTQKQGIDKPEWLKFCTKFGDWLVKNQNDDGSYYLRYDWHTGKPTHESKYTTTNVIRFLIRLYNATQDLRYLDTALKAGEFSYNFINEDYLYVGGVIDNPNVKDRESGQQALYAFMALYDATGKQKWLDAARQAADYTETFMYAYNVPMAQNDTLTDFPRHLKTTGQTLIATGHSAVDNGLSFSSFQYYRLYLFTGDEHYKNIAKMMMYNSLQTMDIDSKMGYKYPALQTEAFKLTSPRGHSVRQWLPWNGAAVMDPIHRFKDAFDVFGINELEDMPLEKQRKYNKQYGKTLGIWSKEK